jgi:hypothetical protein
MAVPVWLYTKRDSLLGVLSLLVLLQAPAAFCSPTPACVSQQPRDVRLQVEVADGNTRFRIGEVIPLKLSFNSSAAGKYQINLATYDRSGRMNYEDFMLEPDAGWSDPLEDYFSGGGFMMGGLTGFDFLSGKPKVISLDLNEWVRFDRPGEYVLRVVSRRVGLTAGGRLDGEPATELRSDELRLTILPAERVWQQATLKKAVAALDRSPTVGDVNPSEARAAELRAALKTLRFLGTADAAKEMARRLRGEDSRADFECMFGLVGSRFRDVALDEMRRLLADPDHPVSSRFLYALTVLMRGGETTLAGRMEEDRRNGEALQRELLDVISQKRGKALALSLNTILEVGGYAEGKQQQPDARMAARVAAVFDQLPPEKQRGILESSWDLIKGAEFLPVLRKYALRYREFNVPNEENAYNSLHVSGAALRHWYELNPDEARPVVIREITRPRPRYGAGVLGLLPEETLPEVEQALAEHFVAEPSSYATENLASLLQRYATGAVLTQVLPVVDEHVGKWACAIQAPALAYLLRVDPAAAKPRLEAAIAARGDGYSACNHSLLVEVGALRLDPLLEEVAIRSLDDEDPEVAGNAATFLGRYGTASAETALWESLTRWNEKWRGSESEFRYVPGESDAKAWQRNLGSNLIQALGTGKSWLADEAKLNRLGQLAVGRDMRRQVDSMLSNWEKGRRTISFYRARDRLHFRVLQYETDSLDGLREKLAQFPAGSEFNWVSGAPSDGAEQVMKEVSELLAARGIKLIKPQK